MKILVCGGAGFIGSAYIRNHLTNAPDDEIINYDSLTIGSNLKNLISVDTKSNYKFIQGDITDSETLNDNCKNSELVVNFAAETHVDRSINNAEPFIKTNIYGTYYLLEAVRKYDIPFVHVSTDEIYGDILDGMPKKEDDMVEPGNPYAASKASADLLVKSYTRTYGIKSIITRCTNNFGPFQFPEKLIPKTIIRAIKNQKIPLYGDGNQIRSWIYVTDHVQAIDSLIKKQRFGEIYNISGWDEIKNRLLVEKILDILDKKHDLIEFVEDRPGHDKRYALDSAKIQNDIGWKPKHDFENALEETVTWYLNNENWWKPLANEKSLHPTPWTMNWKN